MESDMQTRGRFTQRPSGPATETRRRTVASYGDYADAERAVDYLSDHGFPVERTAIVARDLQLVEQVTGRMSYVDAALRGLLSGALAGVLIGWLFAVFDWVDPAIARGWLILDGFWFGAVVGAIAGLIAHALTRGRRDFASVQTVNAGTYEVVADEEVADEAERLLGQMSGASAS
jgi:hypothetical protein